jgi:hypothetical protein
MLLIAEEKEAAGVGYDGLLQVLGSRSMQLVVFVVELAA